MAEIDKKDDKAPAWAWWLVIGVSFLIFIITTILLVDKTDKPLASPAEARVAAEIPYVALHTFPDGIKQITIPIGPERWEGIALPLDAIAYDVDVLGVDDWRQIRTWDGKNGPVLKKGQSAYVPIQRNSDIKEATFWIRGEGESIVTINR